MLLIVLLILAAGSAYYLFFFRPNREEKQAVEARILDTESQIETDQLRLVRKQQMLQELDDLFARDPDPASMAPYDNGRVVMHELNSVLAEADEYSLSFNTAPSAESEDVIRRTVALNFTCSSYDQARDILQQLHDSDYRCLLTNLSVTYRQTAGPAYSDSWLYSYITGFAGSRPVRPTVDPVTETSVSGNLVFFEYTDGANAGPEDSAEADSWTSDTIISSDGGAAVTPAAPLPAAPAVEAGFTGWADNALGQRFYFRDGQQVFGQWIDGAYYVQSNGVLATGFQYVESDAGAGFYLFNAADPDMGRMLTGWQQVSEGNFGWFDNTPGSPHYGQCTYTDAWGQFDNNYRPVF